MNDYKELVESLRICSNNRLKDNAYFNMVSAADAIERLVKERDAAIHDLDMAVCGQESYPCGYCANYGIKPIDVEDVCETCTDCEEWEWRGVEDDT